MASSGWGKLTNFFYLALDNLKGNIGYLSEFFYVRIYFIASGAVNLLSWLAAYNVKIRMTSDLVVLHYNIDFGINLIGSPLQIYTLPLIGLIFFIVNVFLVFAVQKEGRFLIHALFLTSFLVNVFLLINLGLIYLVNFR